METIVTFNVPHLVYWDWRVAADLFFGGIGVGAFLFAVLVDWRYKGKYRRVCHTAALSAPIFVVVGLLFMLTEMGQPMRLFFTFTVFQPKSPLWWGGIFQTLLIVGMVVYAYQWSKPLAGSRRQTIGFVLLPIALIVGAYHGFLLSLIRARPLWNTGPTLVAAVLGFITTGIAAVMFIHLIRMMVAGRLSQTEWVQEFLSDMAEVRNILGLALILQVVTFFVWWISLQSGLAPAQTALNAANAAYGPLFWYGGIGLGLVIPLALGAYTVVYGGRAGVRLEVNMIWLTSGLILVGGFIFRLAVVLGGQMA
jgi:protein NrfD